MPAHMYRLLSRVCVRLLRFVLIAFLLFSQWLCAVVASGRLPRFCLYPVIAVLWVLVNFKILEMVEWLEDHA